MPATSIRLYLKVQRVEFIIRFWTEMLAIVPKAKATGS